MEKKGIKEKIVQDLESEKTLRRDEAGLMFFYAFLILFLALLVLVGCFVFDVHMLFSYKAIFSAVLILLFLDIVVLIIIISNTKISISQRKIKKEAKPILKRLLILKNEKSIESCYNYLRNRTIVVTTPEELDQVISDLKEILGYKNLADGGLHIG